MDRRTFLKSAGAKGAAVMATSVVGTEMLHATEVLEERTISTPKQKRQ